MSYREIKTLKAMVEDVLKDIPETRNSDITLTIEIWKRFYPEKIHAITPGHEQVWLRDLYDLPREDNVKRSRAFFQNDKKLYLPTDLKIAKARGIEEDEWRVAMGYPTKQSAGTPAPSWTPPSEVKKPCLHSFRDGTDWRTHCRLCGVARVDVVKETVESPENQAKLFG